MTDRILRDEKATYQAWALDQLTKSAFFLEKLHEWALLEVAQAIENVQGESLHWNWNALGISKRAWNKIIHNGIKPVTIFAHPHVLQNVKRSVAYYRMLAMVSQKSMGNIGLTVNQYEMGKAFPKKERAEAFAHRFNQIISHLLEAEPHINIREFDLWRGMAAGAQAQGSWQNSKGKRIEIQVKNLIRQRVRSEELVETETLQETTLNDGRLIRFADEPDIAIYQGGFVLAAVEIKGGIDPAAILERVGAAIKSLSRAKQENPQALTILLLPQVSLTPQAAADLTTNQTAVNHWFTIENLLNDNEIQERIFGLLEI